MNIGKIVAVLVVAFIAFIAFGDKIINLYKHQNDLGFKLDNITYTTVMYDAMDRSEQKILISEIENLCVRKHYADNLDCTDTGYWFANNLTDEGVENTLIMNWIPLCTHACETKGAPLPVVNVTEEKKTKTRKPGEYGGATKWFWED